MARKGVGTVIGRKSVSKGKEYQRIRIYIQTKISEDTAFPFKVEDPCAVEIDLKRRVLIVSPISISDAEKMGWTKRPRKRKDTFKLDLASGSLGLQLLFCFGTAATTT